MTAFYVSCDTAARSVGSEEVAAELARQLAAHAASQGEAAGEPVVVRPGSRGLLWLEPLVEVATASERIAFGPVRTSDVAELVSKVLAGEAGKCSTYLGPTMEIDYLARQDRVTFARVGVIDPLSPKEYEAHGGLQGLRRATAMDPKEIIAEVVRSGLRGRGGAGFPTGVKWQTVLDSPGELKFVCCNADEGDSGTYADRMLMEGDPFSVIEGMAIAARAVGAAEGYIYIRSEYPAAVATMRAAVAIAEAQGWIGGENGFSVHVRVGAGAYICGEETSMLESLEGKRAVARAKPPLPAIEGLFGCPTVVNNVLSLAAVPFVLSQGAEAYEHRGTGRSRGTQVFQLAGNVRRAGIVEAPFGITLRELIYGFGGGSASGRPIRAVQIGGPLGSYLPADRLDLPTDYEALATEGAMLGHGGVVVFDDTVDMARQARFAMEFCAEESCGKCTPCRVGAVRGVEVIDRIIAGTNRDENLEVLEDLCELMVEGSLCAMGGLTPQPVRSALRHFSQDFLGGDGEGESLAIVTAGSSTQQGELP
ncbi:MAG: NADH-ubiquinone oxidoreductase-F iron-sulfur binding region domain-containing protein [Acidimicrobiales bacterium]